MNTFPISLRGTTPSVGVGWVGSGEKIERRDGTGRLVIESLSGNFAVRDFNDEGTRDGMLHTVVYGICSIAAI